MAERAGLRVAVQIPVEPERAWAALTDWDRQGEWIFATRVRTTAGDGRSVGSELAGTTGYGPLAFVDTMRIVEWDPPHRCGVLHTGRVVRGAGVFAVEPAPSGAAVVWQEWLDLPAGRLGRLGWVVVRPLTAAGIRLSLRRFGRWAARYEAPSADG